MVQAHVSGLLFLGAAFFGATAWRIWHIPGPGRMLVAPLSAAAALGVGAALGPWLWRQRVAGQRRLIAASLLACGGGLVSMLPGVGYAVVFGAQGVLAAAILTEVGTRRAALAWFWGCTLALAMPAVLYWWLVVSRAGGD
jgi:hypothetical protein